MSENKTTTVTLESGGQTLNPITTQPGPIQGHPGYGPPQGDYLRPQSGYGIQPVVHPPQADYGIQPVVHQQGVNPPPQGSYETNLGYGPNSHPQAGYGIPPGANLSAQAGYGIPQGGNSPAQGGYGIQPPPGSYGSGPPPGNNFGTNGTHPFGGPSNDNWMTRPHNIPNCPPGLEYLTTIDTLIVNQIFNVADALADREPENEFIIANSIGQKVYYAKEESDDCSRRICGSRRAFRMKVFDNFGNQVMNLSRPIACQACCFPCCLQKMEVSAPPGTVVGLIDQEWAFLYPTFAIKGPTGSTILRIQGPWCTMNCYTDVEFKVLTADGGNEVGKISKRWSGYANENSSKMDVFGISFPMDLDVRMKAVMLGACFLIDMMYFEQGVSNPSKTNTRGQNNAPQHQQLNPV